MRILLFILTFGLIQHAVFAQEKVIKNTNSKPKRSSISIGSGFIRSELFLSQSIKEEKRMPGFAFHLVYSAHKVIRISTEYNYYIPANMTPTWKNVHYSGLEVNTHFKARLENVNAIFYPIAGFSYHLFSGYFTGRNDSKGTSLIYKPESRVNINWLGLNLGAGYEYRYKRLGFYGEFKIRFTMDHMNFKNAGVKDVSSGIGIKYYFGARTIKTILRGGTRNRYFLKTVEVD